MGELSKNQNKVPDLDLIINSFFTEKFDKRKAKIYFRILHLNLKNFRVQHSALTEYVYSNYNDVKLEDANNDKEIYWQENVHILKEYLLNLVKNLDGHGADYTEEEKKLIKSYKKEILELPDRIFESVKLALGQYKALFEKLTKATNILTDAIDDLEKVNKNYEGESDKLNAASKKLDVAQKKLGVAQKKLDNSTSEFISMLGIFSALIFGVFGGFEAFKTIFTNIDKASVDMVIIDSSILLLGLIILIFLLIQSISILSGKNFLACGCKNISECDHKFYERYPLFSFSIGLFLFTLLLGLLCKENIKLPLNLKLETVLSYLGLIILIIMSWFIGRNIYKKKKKTKLICSKFKKILYYIKPF
ncbi:hypothetical protein [Lactobacillus sp. M0396]|uniref:hypothetical protein n=1 Tax=Lactobacillus sp. M0396 TaxID=2751030 RepID=UPI0018DBEA9B|nr:hypothetical protein [Lactobacillus sp. M0396]MBI0032713.1 hypothetical protein [Lactobacillus sp. M0396]